MMMRRIADLTWILGSCTLLLLGATGIAAATPVPELDAGSAASGIALAVGAAALMAERYRRRN